LCKGSGHHFQPCVRNIFLCASPYSPLP
jgi:hypothetical protein